MLNLFLYKPCMTRRDVYKYFISDVKKESPAELTRKFYRGLRGVCKDIVDFDIENYYGRGHCNMSRVLVKHELETENTIYYKKRKLKENLYLQYISMYGIC